MHHSSEFYTNPTLHSHHVKILLKLGDIVFEVCSGKKSLPHLKLLIWAEIRSLIFVLFTTGTWASCYFAEEKAHHIIKFLNAFHKIAVIIVHHAPQLCSANRFPKLGKKRKKTKENKTICDSATEKPKPKPVDQNCILVQPFVHARWICNQILKCLCKISMQISSSNLLHIQSEPTISEIEFVLQIRSSLDNFAKPMTDSIKGLQSIQFWYQTYIHTYIYIYDLATLHKSRKRNKNDPAPPTSCLLGFEAESFECTTQQPTSTITAPARFRC